jgi:hypothetical protein
MHNFCLHILGGVLDIINPAPPRALLIKTLQLTKQDSFDISFTKD